MNKSRISIICITLSLLMARTAFSEPYFRLQTEDEWQNSMMLGQIQAMTGSQWDAYMSQWQDPQNQREGDPYPATQFLPPELYVYGGGGGGGGGGIVDPFGPGLVMTWGSSTIPQGSYASAWRYEYQLDPDLSNSTISITVIPPQFDKLGNQINVVSFGIQDINGKIRAWYWNTGVPGGIPWNVPTVITINTALIGLAAANPLANGYVSNPAFDITKSMVFIVDENAQWVGGATPIPPPGQVIPKPWNYWSNLTVSPNPPGQGLPVGINIDIHQDIQDVPQFLPNDFHVEGRIESGLPLGVPGGGGWSNPPVLISHVDGQFPIFSYIITHDTTDPAQNWYNFRADWSLPPGMLGIPYCTILHLGLEFQVTCHNIIIDLKGWWTLNGQPVNKGTNKGFIPIPGFDVQDNILSSPGNKQYMRMQNGNGNGIPEPGEIEAQIVQIDLVSLSEEELYAMLGAEPFRELHESGRQAGLLWVPVVDQQGMLISQTNPVPFMIDSFFDIFLEVGTGIHPIHPVKINPGGFLIARERIKFINNSSEPELRWVWEIHGAHQQESDLGDAPDSSNSFGAAMTAYPWGVQANYPTVYTAGSPPNGPIHLSPLRVAHLGQAVTREQEADILIDQDPTNNIIPPKNLANLDMADDGVLGMPLKLPACAQTRFRYIVNMLNPAVNLYTNVWFDFNRDGDWDDMLQCSDGSAVPEWAVQNQLIAANTLPAGLNVVVTPPFRGWHPDAMRRPIWMRITLSEQIWIGGAGIIGNGGSGPVGGYLYGETEDYIFVPLTGINPSADLNLDGIVNMYDLAIMADQWLLQTQ